MNSYEVNIGRWKVENQGDDDEEEMNLLKSLLYCIIPKQGLSDVQKKKIDKQLDEDDVLGIEKIPKVWSRPDTSKDIESYNSLTPWKSQLVTIAKIPEFMSANFDPHDMSSKYNEEDYLVSLENLDVDM